MNLSPLPDTRAAEQVATLLTRPGLRVERIVSLGQASPPGFWYDQAEGDWVLVLRLFCQVLATVATLGWFPDNSAKLVTMTVVRGVGSRRIQAAELVAMAAVNMRFADDGPWGASRCRY